MGDTLPHLADSASVESIFAAVAKSLQRGGLFAATFRDYAATPLQGERRFIPVRSDANRILTCFLEYAADRVTVTDLLHERQTDGWIQRISSYSKLRLAPEWVVSKLSAVGLRVHAEAGPGGMVRVVARKP